MPDISIRWRLVIGYGVILTAVLAGLALFVYRLQEAWLIDQAEDRVHAQVLFALRNVSVDDPDAAISDVVAVLGSSETHVVLLSPDASPLAQAGGGTAIAVSSDSVETALGGQFAREVASSDDGRRMAVLMPVRDETGQVVGVLQTTVPLTDVDEALDSLLLLLTIGVVAAHVLGLLLIFAVTTFALRPLSRMVEVVRSIGRGDYGARQRLPRGADEAGELGRAFDSMLGEVQTTVERRERNEQMTRQFAADASHELKSPLTVISGYVDVLLRGGADDPAERERALIGIQRESTRMSRLVSDLLTLAQLEAGSWPMHAERIDANALARGVIDEARTRIDGRRITVARSGERPLMVQGDAESLGRALRNLVDNAVRYTREGGLISAEVTEAADRAVITVRDDGEGIDPEHLPHLFERFYRADATRYRNGGSAGLGLAITKAIVVAHGGTIDVTSTTGSGTEFRMALPLLRSDAVNAAVVGSDD